MADYWKSQPRKFCQYCKCWIADNKPSVEFHERGKNHKENVAAKIAEIKKKSIDKLKQEEKMSKEFAAMEEAALKAYEEDVKRMQMESGSSSEAPTTAQPKPQPPKQEKPRKKAARGNPGKARESNLWMEGRTEDGHTYYYNTATGVSTWEKPARLQGGRPKASHQGHNKASSGCDWMEAVSPDGYTYYYNAETGESSWERPADLPGSGVSGEVEEEPQPPGMETSPNGGQAPTPAEGTGDDGQQSKAPKISFRKRKAETEPSQREAGGGADKGKEEEPNTPAAPEEPQKVKAEVEEEPNTPAAPEEPRKVKAEVEEEPNTPAAPEEPRKAKAEVEEKKEEKRARRPRGGNPYGTWEQVQLVEEESYASVDLQLPRVEAAEAAPDVPELRPPPEPKPRFRERTITSLGGVEDGGGPPASFRKSKTQNGKARSLRQRGKDD